MVYKLLITFIFCSLFLFKTNAQYDKLNVNLLSHWDNPAIVAEPHYQIRYSGVWGYTNPTDSRKYAIVGSSDGTYYIEITNPTAPILRDYVPGRRDSCIWREYKTYDKYVYMTSDDPAPNSFQIADLSYLPDSVHVVLDNDSIFVRAHALYIDGDKLYCSSVKDKTGTYHSMSVYSLANPEIPLLLRSLGQDYLTPSNVHDMFVRNDTAYVSGGFDGLFIYKFESNNTFTQLSSLTNYSEQGYNHSSYLTPNGKTLIFTDEVPVGLGIKLLDVSDLNNLTMKSIFRTNAGPTPHNPYIIGPNKAIVSYYQDGLQIFDISDPENPIRTGYFDTDTLSNFSNSYPGGGYQGNWGAYVDFGGGLIIANDMQNGLYVLDASAALLPLPFGINTINENIVSVSVYPNPFKETATLSIAGLNEKCDLEIYNALGQKVNSIIIEPTTNVTTIKLPRLVNGMYTYILVTTKKEIITKGKLVAE